MRRRPIRGVVAPRTERLAERRERAPGARDWRLVETGDLEEWDRLADEVGKLARALGGYPYRWGLLPADDNGNGLRGFVDTNSEELARAWAARQAREEPSS
jgi:hypothetical protein